MKKITVIFLLILLIFIFTSGCKKKVNTSPGQIKPGSAEDLANQGLAALNIGEILMAEQKLLKAIKKNPILPIALQGLGVIYLQNGEFDKALNYFKKLLQVNPGHYDAHNAIGIIYIEKGKYDLAKENLLIAANAIKYRTPENAFLNLANLEIRRKKLDAALRYIEKGLKKNKGFAPLYNMRGLVFENKKNYEEAIDSFKKALSLLTEEDVSYLMNIGRVYAKCGKKQEALDVLERALAKTNVELIRKQIRALIKNLEK